MTKPALESFIIQKLFKPPHKSFSNPLQNQGKLWIHGGEDNTYSRGPRDVQLRLDFQSWDVLLFVSSVLRLKVRGLVNLTSTVFASLVST